MKNRIQLSSSSNIGSSGVHSIDVETIEDFNTFCEKIRYGIIAINKQKSLFYPSSQILKAEIVEE